MTVEFIGLSGSGKSTMAKELVSQAAFTLIKIRTRRELLWFNFLFFLEHPVFCFRNFLFIMKNSNDWKMFYYKFMNLLLVHNAKHQKAKRYEKALVDQGHFQNTLSLFEKNISEEKMFNYIKILTKPDKLIVFNLPFEEADRRKEAQGGYARETFGKEYLIKWKKNLEKNFDSLREALPRANFNYSFIDAGNSKEEVLREVLEKINL